MIRRQPTHHKAHHHSRTPKARLTIIFSALRPEGGEEDGAHQLARQAILKVLLDARFVAMNAVPR